MDELGLFVRLAQSVEILAEDEKFLLAAALEKFAVILRAGFAYEVEPLPGVENEVEFVANPSAALRLLAAMRRVHRPPRLLHLVAEAAIGGGGRTARRRRLFALISSRLLILPSERSCEVSQNLDRLSSGSIHHLAPLLSLEVFFGQIEGLASATHDQKGYQKQPARQSAPELGWEWGNRTRLGRSG